MDRVKVEVTMAKDAMPDQHDRSRLSEGIRAAVEGVLGDAQVSVRFVGPTGLRVNEGSTEISREAAGNVGNIGRD